MSSLRVSLEYRDATDRTIRQELIADPSYSDGFRIEGWTGQP